MSSKLIESGMSETLANIRSVGRMCVARSDDPSLRNRLRTCNHSWHPASPDVNPCQPKVRTGYERSCAISSFSDLSSNLHKRGLVAHVSRSVCSPDYDNYASKRFSSYNDRHTRVCLTSGASGASTLQPWSGYAERSCSQQKHNMF
jgi:hypothetical protein